MPQDIGSINDGDIYWKKLNNEGDGALMEQKVTFRTYKSAADGAIKAFTPEVYEGWLQETAVPELLEAAQQLGGTVQLRNVCAQDRTATFYLDGEILTEIMMMHVNELKQASGHGR